MNKTNHTEVNILETKTAPLEDVAAMYRIPLWTLRKWVSRRKFPGLIRSPGGRRWYIDLKKFDAWFKSGEVEGPGKEDA